MDKRQQINTRNLLRSVLGRANEERALRVKAVTGTIVGRPEAPLNELGFRNLLAKSLDMDIDGKPSLNLHVSAVNDIENAYIPKEAHLSKQRYLNSLFVEVLTDDGDKKVCVHLAHLSDSSIFDEDVDES